MVDWLAKMINLPSNFLNSSDGPGGGIIQVNCYLYFILFTSDMYFKHHLKMIIKLDDNNMGAVTILLQIMCTIQNSCENNIK